MDLPWIEKYRPQSLDELISHSDISKTISRFLEQNRLPHLLFYGPPGTGKTSTILATAKTLYAPRELNSMVLELNASDARGINVVREQVLSFASTKTLFAGKFKLVILDEADSMTKDAQNALRRIVEKFTENTRFCLICNYLSKIIPAIQSRCTKFRFAPVSFQQMQPRLKEIATTEKVVLTDDGMKAIYRFTSGDMRKAINLMQSAAMSAPKIDESSVYACVAYPSPAEIRSLTDSMLNEPIHSAFKNMLATKNLKGIALQDILTELHPLVMKINFPDSVRCDLIIALAELEHRMSVGASERLQLAALVASFARAKSSLEQVAG
ncbi:Replication factor C (RF-C) subunit [Clonorchis sinensis]|uniref:Replication factor C (RF-C) subunit n=1 Tax=Clonorchis sinensis TaxID=79923 RepID=A0A8T1MMA7_CLOSI|nr:Replication factor C (RF-C) subunit [Clonorchis sinensis]